MGFDDAYALLPFDVPWVKRAVHDVKFGGTFGYLEAFGDALAERLPRVVKRVGAFDAVTYVPLADERKRRRGFDQAERLALDIAHRLGSPHQTLLTRNRITAAQAELGGADRRRNVFAAFDPTPELFSSFLARLDSAASGRAGRILSLSGLSPDNISLPTPTTSGLQDRRGVDKTLNRGHPMGSVLLIDDVLTTGATLSSAAKILKAFGVERVTAVTIAYRSDEQFLARLKRRNIDWWSKEPS